MGFAGNRPKFHAFGEVHALLAKRKKTAAARRRPRASSAAPLPTMGVIASELGLSRQVVSYVINGIAEKRGVAEHTARRVRQHLRDAAYAPDRFATRLRAKNDDLFGLLVVGEPHSFLPEALNRLYAATSDRPQCAEVVSCRSHGVAAGLAELTARRVRRLIWISAEFPQGDADEMARLRKWLGHFTRVVVYNWREGPNMTGLFDRPSVARVGTDHVDAYRQLGRRLRGLGHRRVALPSIPPETVLESDPESPLWRDFYAYLRERMNVLRLEGLTPFGVRPPESTRVAEWPGMGDSLARAVRTAMAENGCTAAVFGNDVWAARAMKSLQGQGVRVPEDLTITGYTGLPFTEFMSPALTTMRIPVAAMADNALRLLDPEVEPEYLTLPLELVIRESCGPAPRNSVCNSPLKKPALTPGTASASVERIKNGLNKAVFNPVSPSPSCSRRQSGLFQRAGKEDGFPH